MTTYTVMNRPRDNSKTLVQRPDQQSNGITHEAFVNLTQALENALAFELGKRRDLRVTRFQGSRRKGSSRPGYPTRAEPLSTVKVLIMRNS